jgi:hypothetical protein
MKVKQTAIEFEPQIAKLFKQTHGTKIKLDLKKVILLDSQSTMDLICDPALVESTFNLVDRSEKRSCLLLACDLLVAFRWDVSRTCEIL